MRRESARGAERPLPGSVRQCEMAHALPPWAAEEELARARAWRGCLGTRKGRRGSWKAKAAPSRAWTHVRFTHRRCGSTPELRAGQWHAWKF